MIPPILLTYAARIGVKGAIIAALATFGVVQTVRIEGALWIDGYRADLAACERDKASLVAASAEAERLDLENRIRREAQSIENARFTDAELLNAHQDGIDWANAHNARRSLRPEGRLRSGATVAAPGDSTAASSDGPDTAAIVDAIAGLDDPVAVEADDVLICTDSVLRLEAVQTWAAGLNAPQ